MVRDFLENLDFIEIETPVLSIQAGGANARPFTTFMNAMDTSLQMRIAPELYLKVNDFHVANGSWWL